MKVKFLLLALLAFGSANAAEVTVTVGTANSAAGQIITNPVGSNCSGCVALPISGTITSVAGASTAPSNNGSTTVTTGLTFQTLLAANANRKGCLIQNPTTATEILWVFVGPTASAIVAKSYTIAAGGTFSCATGQIVISDNIAVTATTSGHAFVETDQ
jgi:hypothetical protein